MYAFCGPQFSLQGPQTTVIHQPCFRFSASTRGERHHQKAMEKMGDLQTNDRRGNVRLLLFSVAPMPTLESALDTSLHKFPQHNHVFFCGFKRETKTKKHHLGGPIVHETKGTPIWVNWLVLGNLPCAWKPRMPIQPANFELFPLHSAHPRESGAGRIVPAIVNRQAHQTSSVFFTCPVEFKSWISESTELQRCQVLCKVHLEQRRRATHLSPRLHAAFEWQ